MWPAWPTLTPHDLAHGDGRIIEQRFVFSTRTPATRTCHMITVPSVMLNRAYRRMVYEEEWSIIGIPLVNHMHTYPRLRQYG